jgi:hypothetical protein
VVPNIHSIFTGIFARSAIKHKQYSVTSSSAQYQSHEENHLIYKYFPVFLYPEYSTSVIQENFDGPSL